MSVFVEEMATGSRRFHGTSASVRSDFTITLVVEGLCYNGDSNTLMGLIPDISEDISDDTVTELKNLIEISQWRFFKEGVDEEKLGDISEEDLFDAIDIAEQHQENNEEFVREKSRLLQTAAGMGAVSVGAEGIPISFSVPGILGGAIYGYSRLFSREVEIRKTIIDMAAYKEITGNRWRDNWRFQRNLRLYYTKIIFQTLSTIILYEEKPVWVKLAFEARLSKHAGTGFRERAMELAEKYNGEREFERLKEEEMALPAE